MLLVQRHSASYAAVHGPIVFHSGTPIEFTPGSPGLFSDHAYLCLLVDQSTQSPRKYNQKQNHGS